MQIAERLGYRVDIKVSITRIGTIKDTTELRITKKGETKAVLMSVEELESWEETNEILADKTLMKDLKQSEKEIAQGKGISFEQLKKNLGWG